MKKFDPKDYTHIQPVARDFNNLEKEELLQIIENLDPSRMKKETADFSLKLLELKIQEESQRKILQKQNWIIGATWFLAASTIIATFINLA
jgi:nicotinic acid mononucleotide adenylyltransferase